MCLIRGIPVALSLLRHLFNELVGHGLTLPNVPRFSGYVLGLDCGTLD